MSYFASFPLVEYDDSIVVDITRRTSLLEKIKQTAFLYEFYDIMDGDRPDTVAYKYYGRSDLHWIILLANDMFDINEWPMTEEHFYAAMLKKYGSDAAMNQVAFYELENGMIVNADYPENKLEITHFEAEHRENETRRRIRLIRPELVDELIRQHEELIGDASEL